MTARSCETKLQLGPIVAECGASPALHVRRTCAHDHVRDGWMCAGCMDVGARMICRTCDEADGHECPVTITSLAGAS